MKLITDGYSKETVELIRKIDDWQTSLIAPKKFDPVDPENYVKTMELSFENICTALESMGAKDVRSLTVFQFYAKLTYFEKRKKRENERAKQRR